MTIHPQSPAPKWLSAPMLNTLAAQVRRTQISTARCGGNGNTVAALIRRGLLTWDESTSSHIVTDEGLRTVVNHSADVAARGVAESMLNADVAAPTTLMGDEQAAHKVGDRVHFTPSPERAPFKSVIGECDVTVIEVIDHGAEPLTGFPPAPRFSYVVQADNGERQGTDDRELTVPEVAPVDWDDLGEEIAANVGEERLARAREATDAWIRGLVPDVAPVVPMGDESIASLAGDLGTDPHTLREFAPDDLRGRTDHECLPATVSGLIRDAWAAAENTCLVCGRFDGDPLCGCGTRMVVAAEPGTPCGWLSPSGTPCGSGKTAVHVLTHTLPVASAGTALCAPHSPWDPTDDEQRYAQPGPLPADERTQTVPSAPTGTGWPGGMVSGRADYAKEPRRFRAAHGKRKGPRGCQARRRGW